MKTIKLRPASSDRPEELASLPILKLIMKQPIGGPGQGSISVDQMRKDIRVLDCLDATPADAVSIELEDDDCATLQEKVRRFPFAMSDRRILDVCDDMANATKTKREPEKAEEK